MVQQWRDLEAGGASGTGGSGQSGSIGEPSSPTGSADQSPDQPEIHTIPIKAVEIIRFNWTTLFALFFYPKRIFEVTAQLTFDPTGPVEIKSVKVNLRRWNADEVRV